MVISTLMMDLFENLKNALMRFYVCFGRQSKEFLFLLNNIKKMTEIFLFRIFFIEF